MPRAIAAKPQKPRKESEMIEQGNIFVRDLAADELQSVGGGIAGYHAPDLTLVALISLRMLWCPAWALLWVTQYPRTPHDSLIDAQIGRRPARGRNAFRRLRRESDHNQSCGQIGNNQRQRRTEMMNEMRELTDPEMELVAAGAAHNQTASVLAVAAYGAVVGSAFGLFGALPGAAIGLIVGIGLAAAEDAGVYD
jgi:hypothetical protein